MNKYKVKVDTSDIKVKKISLVADDGSEVDTETSEGDLVTGIKTLLNRNSVKLEDVEKFVPNLGPGSFTGLKIGVTVANILNWVLGRKDIKHLDYPNYGAEPYITEPKKFKL